MRRLSGKVGYGPERLISYALCTLTLRTCTLTNPMHTRAGGGWHNGVRLVSSRLATHAFFFAPFARRRDIEIGGGEGQQEEVRASLRPRAPPRPAGWLHVGRTAGRSEC